MEELVPWTAQEVLVQGMRMDSQDRDVCWSMSSNFIEVAFGSQGRGQGQVRRGSERRGDEYGGEG